jgi:hypothetical protein
MEQQLFAASAHTFMFEKKFAKISQLEKISKLPNFLKSVLTVLIILGYILIAIY